MALGRAVALEVQQGAAGASAASLRRGATLAGRADAVIAADVTNASSAAARKSWTDFRRLARLQDNVVRRLVERTIDKAIERGRKMAAGNPSLAGLTDADWAAIGAKLSQLRTSERMLESTARLGGRGHRNALSGHIREVLTLHMQGMQHRADGAIGRALQKAITKPGVVVLDTAIHGVVELATASGKVLDPALGSDRMIGRILPRSSQPMKFTMPDGTVEGLPVHGIFEVEHVTEIKGRSNVGGAVKQHAGLEGRADAKYVIIGGRPYELRINPKTVERLIVAPEGSEMLARAQKAAEALPMKIDFFPYPDDFETALQQLTDQLLADLRRTKVQRS